MHASGARACGARCPLAGTTSSHSGSAPSRAAADVAGAATVKAAQPPLSFVSVSRAVGFSICTKAEQLWTAGEGSELQGWCLQHELWT